MEEIIREVESKIIDPYYKNFSLIHIDEDISTPLLLKTFDSGLRYYRLSNIDDFIILGNLKYLKGSLNFCLRWVNEKHCKQDSEQTEDELLRMSIDLFDWGVNYYIISQLYTAYSHQLLDVIVNIDSKEIIFTNTKYKGELFNFYQLHSNFESVNDLYDTLPHSKMEYYFTMWVKEVGDMFAPKINWDNFKSGDLYSIMFKWSENNIFVGISNQYSLSNYTLKDLRQFYTILFIGLSFISFIEEKRNKKYTDKYFDTAILHDSKPEFIKFLSEVTNLPENIVGNIVKDLTFNSKSLSSHIGIQPFILSNTNRYYLLPRLFTMCEPNRMFIGAYNKSDKKNDYANLITIIEKQNVDKLKKLFRDAGYRISKTKKFNKTVEPDVIICDNNEILICEFKNFITPISTVEVYYRIKELEKAKKQLSKYKEFFELNKNLLQKEFGLPNVDFNIGYMLIFNDSIPVPFIIKGVVMIDYYTIENIINPQKCNNIKELIKEIQRKYNKMGEKDFSLKKESIKVEDWTFIRELYVKH